MVMDRRGSCNQMTIHEITARPPFPGAKPFVPFFQGQESKSRPFSRTRSSTEACLLHNMEQYMGYRVIPGRGRPPSRLTLLPGKGA